MDFLKNKIEVRLMFESSVPHQSLCYAPNPLGAGEPRRVRAVISAFRRVSRGTQTAARLTQRRSACRLTWQVAAAQAVGVVCMPYALVWVPHVGPPASMTDSVETSDTAPSGIRDLILI